VLNSRKYSLCVKNIPEEHNNISSLNTYFQKFGKVQNINVDLRKKQAIVKFMQIESAVDAANSKDEILGNSAIKIIYTTTQPNSSNTSEQKGENNSQEESKEAAGGKS
jgi:hypothetical protein